MNGERAVLFATDPPYLVDYDGSNHPTRNKDWSQSYGVTWDDSSQGAELYDGFIAAAVAEAITEDAAWYCWHASRRQAMLEACWEKAGAFVHQQIIWVKDRGVLTRSHYLWKHEPCFMGWRRPNRPPKVAEETLPSTWEMPSFAKDERPDHPTPKPLDAFGIPMRQHVARGGLCYEPFSGSGSQIMAGEANGRRVFAMEISPAYVDVAIERWQAETGRDAILDGDGRTFAEVEGPSGWARLRAPPRGPTRPDDVDGVALPSSGLPAGADDAVPLRPLALLRCRRARPRAPPRMPRISCCGSRRAGRLRRGHPRLARMEEPRPWIGRLSGTTLPPSTAARGEARWTSSLGAIRCQPFSVAGKRRGADDPRHLWPHVARIIGEVEPPFVFLENVAPSSPPRLPPKSPQDWSVWATALRQASSRRRRSVRRIGAKRLFILAHRERDHLADPAPPARGRDQAAATGRR